MTKRVAVYADGEVFSNYALVKSLEVARDEISINLGAPMQIERITTGVLVLRESRKPSEISFVVAEGKWPEIWDTFVAHAQMFVAG